MHAVLAKQSIKSSMLPVRTPAKLADSQGELEVANSVN
jgi:hypothetical protein